MFGNGCHGRFGLTRTSYPEHGSRGGRHPSRPFPVHADLPEAPRAVLPQTPMTAGGGQVGTGASPERAGGHLHPPIPCGEQLQPVRMKIAMEKASTPESRHGGYQSPWPRDGASLEVDGRDFITERVPGMNRAQVMIGARLLRNETWGKRQAVMTEPGSSAGSDGSRDPGFWG